MKTPFTDKGDMVNELQTAKHYIETLGHHSYDIGFTDGCRYCEKIIYDRVLEIIDKAQTYKMAVGSTDLFIDREAFREEVLALKGEQEWLL